MHVKHPPLNRQSMFWEHRLLERLRPHLPEIPVPLPAHDGRTFLLHEKRPVWLTPYAHGEPAELARSACSRGGSRPAAHRQARGRSPSGTSATE
jgi:Ser/Thr protein kinase RdoA (MazF antagonist)